MKAKPGFNLRNVCGEQIIVAEGKENMKEITIRRIDKTGYFTTKEQI